MTHYLTHARLNRNAPENALKALFDPNDDNVALDAHHRLIWSLFPGNQYERDFLWRSAGGGRFYILSARKPRHSPLFLPLQSKPFAPVLSAGDRLGFLLRVNPTRAVRSANREFTRSGGGRALARGRRVDIVVHAMRQHGKASDVLPAGTRLEIAQIAARNWLDVQGKQHGFALEQFLVDDYRTLKPNRFQGAQANIGVLDLSGVLAVRDPLPFTRALIAGFGRAKAFGCGLMLVRRISPPSRE